MEKYGTNQLANSFYSEETSFPKKYGILEHKQVTEVISLWKSVWKSTNHIHFP